MADERNLVDEEDAVKENSTKNRREKKKREKKEKKEKKNAKGNASEPEEDEDEKHSSPGEAIDGIGDAGAGKEPVAKEPEIHHGLQSFSLPEDEACQA